MHLMWQISKILMLAMATSLIMSSHVFGKDQSALINLAEDLMAAEKNQTANAPETIEFQIDQHFIDYEEDDLDDHLGSDELSVALRNIFQHSKTLFFSDVTEDMTSAKNALTNCASSSSNKYAYKCSILLALHAFHSQNTNDLLNWSTRAANQVHASNLAEEDQGYALYQTSELLFLSWVLNNNTEETIRAGYTFLTAAEENSYPIGAHYHIHNLSSAASKNADYTTALEITKLLIPELEILNENEQTVLYYSLTARYTENSEYENAIDAFKKLSSLNPSDQMRLAAQSYNLFAHASLSEFDYVAEHIESHDEQLKLAGMGNTKFSFYSDKALIKLLHFQGQDDRVLDEAIQLTERIETNLTEQISAERANVSNELSLIAERLRNQSAERALEQDLSRQQIESQRSYMMMLSILVTFLLFSLGTVLWLYRRQTRLNAELVIANEQAQIGQQTKERFIAVVGHELRTPLNPIINLCDVISQSLKDKVQRNLLLTIKGSGISLLRIVENMIFISDADSRPKIYPENFNIEQLCRNVLDEFVDQIKASSAIYDGETGLKHLYFSRTQGNPNVITSKIGLTHILRNLIDNAIKFTPEGSVKVMLHIEDPKEVRIEIEDTGIGMDAKSLGSLLSPYVQADMSMQRQFGGAGLGMAVISKWCEILNIEYACESEPEKGTKITLTFSRFADTENGIVRQAA